MATREAKMQVGGEKFLNMALAVKFRGRTIESIKGHRRGRTYKEVVRQMIEEVRQEKSEPSPSPSPRPSGRRFLLMDPPPDETDEVPHAQFLPHIGQTNS